MDEPAEGAASEVIFGTTVLDPFRWLEGDLHEDPRVAAWAEEQARRTRAHLAALPGRDSVAETVRSAWDFEKLSCPVRRGDRSFHEWNDGLRPQALVRVSRGTDGSPTVLIDPNAMEPDDGNVVRDWLPSRDGSRLAYTVQRHGGDQRTLRFLEVDGARRLTDEVPGLIAGQFAWHPDGRSVFYTAFEPPGRPSGVASRVKRHRLGQGVENDETLYDAADSAALLHFPHVSDDGRWLVIVGSNGGATKCDVAVLDLARSDARIEPLVVGLADRWQFLGGDERGLLFVTDRNAPSGRVVSLDPTLGTGQTPRTVVTEDLLPIRGATLAGSEVILRYQDGAASAVRRYGRDGRALGSIALPERTVVDQMRGDPAFPEVFLRVSSMVLAPEIHRCDLASGLVSVQARPRTPWRVEDHVVRQIVATSPDGTPIRVTLAHARSLDAGVPQPTVLMVYGGFGISPDLCFWESRFAWIALGGVFAIAHVRGGAEHGAAWADAGRKAGRHQVVADYLAAARALCDAGITSSERLVAMGSSNGGLVVATALNTQPEAFAAALCRVPVTDLLRYTRFTIGRLWIDELGDPDDEQDFHLLRALSPLHNLRRGMRYPAVLVATADADDRVVPAHSFKYVAALQAADIGPRPRLLRLEKDAGHGEGKPSDRLIEEFTDLWSFAAAQVGLRPDSLSAAGASASSLDDIAARFWALQCREFPLTALQAGVRPAGDDVLAESVADHERRAQAAASLLAELQRVPTEPLDARGAITHTLLEREFELLTATVATGTHLRPSLFPFGADMAALRLGSVASISTADDAEDYLARLAAIPRAIASFETTLREGRRAGVRYPRPAVERAVAQAQSLAAMPLAAHPLLDPLRRGSAAALPPDLLTRASRLVAEPIAAALAGYARVLQETVAPAASIAVDGFDSEAGRDRYRLAIRLHATVDHEPDWIHTLGLREVERIEGEIADVAVGAGFGGDVEGLRRHVAGAATAAAGSAQSLRERIGSIAKRVDGCIPEWIGHLPRSTYGVRTIPDAIAAGMPPAYAQPNPADGRAAGTLWVTPLAEKLPAHLHVALTLHEGWPGHLMHLALIQEQTALPAFQRFNAVRYSACLEGWALYCEWLGEAMGLYESPLERFGRLDMEMWRACRLVVDTGIHAFGWTRERAVDFMRGRLSLSPATIEAEVDRYFGWPGQALGYQLGNIAFREMRRDAESALGARFDVRAFHDTLLGAGPVPLPLLSSIVRRWIGEQKPSR